MMSNQSAHIFTIANQKGGSGKSTLAINLATKLLEASDKVLIIDTDPQKSIESFTDIREAESNKDKGLRPFTLVNRTGNITESLKQFVQIYDYVIIDTGGIDSQESRKAMLFADSLIVPTTPSHFDFEVLYMMFERILEIKDTNEAMQISIVMNKISTNVFLHKELLDFQNAITAIKEQLDSNNDFRLLDNVLSDRIAYKRAISEGKGITEYTDMKSKAEFEMVFEELLQKEQIC